MLCSVTSCLSEAAWSLCLETHCCPVWAERSWEKRKGEKQGTPTLAPAHKPSEGPGWLHGLPSSLQFWTKKDA